MSKLLYFLYFSWAPAQNALSNLTLEVESLHKLILGCRAGVFWRMESPYCFHQTKLIGGRGKKGMRKSKADQTVKGIYIILPNTSKGTTTLKRPDEERQCLLKHWTKSRAHQIEPPSPTQALRVNPFQSRFINRTVPRGGFAR